MEKRKKRPHRRLCLLEGLLLDFPLRQALLLLLLLLGLVLHPELHPPHLPVHHLPLLQTGPDPIPRERPLRRLLHPPASHPQLPAVHPSRLPSSLHAPGPQVKIGRLPPHSILTRPMRWTVMAVQTQTQTGMTVQRIKCPSRLLWWEAGHFP